MTSASHAARQPGTWAGNSHGGRLQPSASTLAERVHGRVFQPADEGYDGERSGFQTAFRHRPDVIVGASDPADVQAAVEFAAAHGLPVTVQATGHGLSVPMRGGMLISTRRMNRVRVDAGTRTAHVAAGVRWKHVVTAAARYGLAPLCGSAPDVGAVSYTLGGGLGLLARQYGYAADHVRSIDVVTADGLLRHVTAESDPDLFWALRGGRNNFGVVTSLEVDLVPVARVFAGALCFDAELAPEVLRTYREWTASLPDGLTSSVLMIAFPDLGVIPAPVRGRRVIYLRLAWTGGAESGERLVAPMRTAGPRLVDSLRDMPYAASGSIYNDPSQPHGYYGTNAMLRALDPAGVDAMLDLAGPATPVPCIVELRHLGGALASPPAVANAVGQRDARYLVRALTPLGAHDAGAARPVHERFFTALTPWVTGRSLNFMYGAGTTADEVRTFYDPADYRRLSRLKAFYDPFNLFCTHHNIPPSPHA